MEIPSVRKNFSELTFQDFVKLIDISGRLRIADDENQLLHILNDLEAMMNVKGVMLGMYNTDKKSVQFSVATFNLDRPLENVFDSSSLHFNQNKTLFKQQINGEPLMSFFYLDCFEEAVNSYQLEILRIIFQQLHSVVTRLHNISKRFTSLGLTDREIEVMQWVGIGKDNWSISKILGVSERTVKFHCKNIFRKFGVNSKLEAISFYHTKIHPYNSAASHRACN